MPELESSSLSGLETNTEICFICGNSLNGKGRLMFEACTPFTRIPLPTKLGAIVGDDFLVVVSKSDEICKRCSILIDQLDELEHNLGTVKSQVIGLLEEKYNVGFILEDITENNEMNSAVCPKCGLPGVHSEEHTCILSSDPEITQDDFNATEPENYFDVKLLDTAETRETIMQKQCLNAKNYLETFDIDIQDSGDSMLNNADLSCTKSVENLNNGTKLLCQCCGILFVNEYEKQIHLESLLNSNLSGSQIQEGCVVKGDEGDLWLLSEELETQTLFTETVYKCTICDFKHGNMEEIEKHQQTHSKEVKHVCHICDIPFLSVSVLARHLKVHERSKGPLDCSVCGHHCHDHLHLQYHHKEKHSTLPSYFTCAICDCGFNSNKELKMHLLQEHPNSKHYSCRDCGQKFRRHAQLENHRRYTHGDAICRACGKRIEDPVKLRQHELRHARTDAKKFDCEDCGRSFKSPGGLRVHKVSHTGGYKFFCEFCGRGFMSSVVLEEHKGVHTKEERYVCDTCGRKFVLYSTFHLHRQWHRNPFPFPCAICGRKFKYRSERSNHVRKSHTGEHPHKCPHCPAEFIKAAYLKRHLSMHTNQYPFNCDHCQKGFEQRRGLARHLSTVHKDSTMMQLRPQICQYKVALRPDEYPQNMTEES